MVLNLSLVNSSRTSLYDTIFSMKPFALKVILVFFAFAIAFGVFELLLRVLMPEPENLAKLQSSSGFLYENKPNADFSGVSMEFNNQIYMNSYGFRDEEFSLSKDEVEFRIAVLGDSQEEALQVSLPDTWQRVMAKKLSDDLGRKAAEGEPRYKRVVAYNFGISGYGTDQEWLTLTKKVWQFSPDMVILAFSPNDVGDTYKNKLVRLKDGKIDVVSAKERAGGNFLGRIARETYTYHIIIKASSQNAFLKNQVDRVRTKILGFGKEDRFFLSDAQLVSGPFEVMASQKNPPVEVNQTWEVIGALISDIMKQANDHNAQFLVTVNIPRAQIDPSGWEFIRNRYHLDADTASPQVINERIGQISKDLGIDFYDLRLDAIDWYKRTGNLHYPIDAHFNVNGHLFMGTKLAEFIEEKRLIR